MSIGIDIGSKTIKVVELVGQPGSFALKAAGAVSYSGNPLEKINSEKEASDFSEVLRKLLKDVKVTGKKVNISVPETSVFSRLMKFPPLTDEEIASAVKWESEELIPMPIADAIVRHTIIERQENVNPPQVLVQLVAVHRLIVEKYVAACESVGLEVASVENEMSAVSRVLENEKGVSVLLDVGSHATNIGIVKSGQVYVGRSVNAAGDSFSRAASLALGVSLVQAEQYKTAYGLSEDQLEGKIAQALLPVVRLLVDDIRKTVQSYSLDVKGEPPQNLILAGGSAGMAGLSTALASQTGMNVSVINPFTTAKVALEPTSASSLAPFAPVYACAVGLGIRKD